MFKKNFHRVYIKSLFWLIIENNTTYMKQFSSNKFLNNNKTLSYVKNSIDISLLSFQKSKRRKQFIIRNK